MAQTVNRLGVSTTGEAIAYVMKTLHTTHGGKMSLARVLAGSIGEGAMLMGSSGTADRVSGVFKLTGQSSEKRGAAGPDVMDCRYTSSSSASSALSMMNRKRAEASLPISSLMTRSVTI